MKTLTRNQLRDTTKREAAVQLDTAGGSRSDRPLVSSMSTHGITEVLNMRVGCWRAPVHFWTGPTVA